MKFIKSFELHAYIRTRICIDIVSLNFPYIRILLLAASMKQSLELVVFLNIQGLRATISQNARSLCVRFYILLCCFSSYILPNSCKPIFSTGMFVITAELAFETGVSFPLFSRVINSSSNLHLAVLVILPSYQHVS